MIPTRPVLRWHGGKWMLAPWIISHFPPHRIYTEPYGGAASVLLRKPRAEVEVYNDLDGSVVALFRLLQKRAEARELERRLRLTPFSRAEFNLSYEPTENPIERARRLIIRSFMGFGSNACTSAYRTGFRANSNRSSTSPAQDWWHYPDAIAAFTERLRGVVIECRPATELMEQHNREDALHYVDPPYVHSTRQPGQQENYRFEMTDADHRELARYLHEMGGGVVLSGYSSGLYDELYRDWHRVEQRALADGARERVEVLWLNDRAWRTSGRLF